MATCQRAAIDGLVLLHLGDEALLVGREAAERVAHQRRQRIAEIEDAGEGECRAQQVRRTHHGDLGVAADDDRVGVVAGMAPAPGHRIAHQHEAGDLVDDVVHPARAEGGAMAAFVPARVAGGAVEHAVDEEERHAPPCAPEPDAAGGRAQYGGDPDDGVADRRAVGALHQLLHRLARHVGVIPFGRGQPGLDRDPRAFADQAVVALFLHHIDLRFPARQPKHFISHHALPANLGKLPDGCG